MGRTVPASQAAESLPHRRWPRRRQVPPVRYGCVSGTARALCTSRRKGKNNGYAPHNHCVGPSVRGRRLLLEQQTPIIGGSRALFTISASVAAVPVGVQWELPDVLACSVQRFRFASNHGAHRPADLHGAGLEHAHGRGDGRRHLPGRPVAGPSLSDGAFFLVLVGDIAHARTDAEFWYACSFVCLGAGILTAPRQTKENAYQNS